MAKDLPKIIDVDTIWVNSDTPSQQLLMTFWVSVMHLMVAELGSKTALEAMLPYDKANGMGGGLAAKRITGIDNKDEASTALLCNFIRQVLFRKELPVYITNKGAVCRTESCWFENNMPELCISICQLKGNGVVEAINPGLEWIVFAKRQSGDPFCKAMVRKRILNDLWGAQIHDLRDSEFDEGQFLHEIDIPYISAESLEDLRNQYYGEIWAVTTRSFIDAVGTDRALDRLLPTMKNIGVSASKKFLKGEVLGDAPLEFISASINRFGGMLQQEGTIKVDTQGFMGKELDQCPFANAPFEVCLQYEAFCQGVCSYLSPDYEFAYDRMMSKGDATCHWTIRKKGGLSKEMPKEDKSVDNPAKILALRYAKGEISREEFMERMEDLRKFGLVK
jgi:hypothetical protein